MEITAEEDTILGFVPSKSESGMQNQSRPKRVRNTTISRPSSAISTYSSLGGDIQNSDQNDQLDELDRIINERFTSTSILKSTINQQNNYSSNQDITSSIKHIDSDLSTSQLQRAKSPPPAYGVIERVKSQPIANTTATNYNNTNLASEKSDLPIFNYNADDNLQDLFDTDVASTMKSNEKIYSSENQTSSITGATRGVSLDLTQSNNNNSNNRVEIDLLKAKLAHAGKESVLMSNQLQLQSQLRDQQKSLEQRCQELSDQLFTLQAQYSESQSKIMVLEMECTKLREDSICVVAKHEEEIMYLQHRHDSELTHSQQQHTENITQIENRHTEMISALKQIHLDELNALKERTKQNASFEQVSNQMKLTSGSIKLMEEQLSERYRTMDIVRQGQFEARERLIGDLEEHARERTVAAESESLRLKGMLAHMESVITNLRGQGNEEKERLRLEHGRLQAMQMSLESEKNVWQRMCTEENISLRAKQKEIQTEKMDWTQERARQQQELTIQRETLARDQHTLQIATQTLAQKSEFETARLKEEQQQAKRDANVMNNNVMVLEQRRDKCRKEIAEYEERSTALQEEVSKCNADRKSLEEAALALQTTSEELQQESAQLTKREEVLAQREHVTAVSLQELKTATDLLAQREKDMQSVVLDLENKLHQLQEEDHLLVQKRLEIAVAHRELLNTRAERILRARADTSPSAVIKNKEAFSRLHMSNYTNFSTNASSSTPAYYSQQQMQGGHSSGVSGNIFPYSETEATTYVSDWRERFEDRLSQAGGAFIMNVYESGPGSSEYELQCARQLLYQNQAY